MATLRRRPVVAVTAIGPGVLVRALLVQGSTQGSFVRLRAPEKSLHRRV
jgi:hypothetical protein